MTVIGKILALVIGTVSTLVAMGTFREAVGDLLRMRSEREWTVEGLVPSAIFVLASLVTLDMASYLGGWTCFDPFERVLSAAAVYPMTVFLVFSFVLGERSLRKPVSAKRLLLSVVLVAFTFLSLVIHLSILTVGPVGC